MCWKPSIQSLCNISLGNLPCHIPSVTSAMAKQNTPGGKCWGSLLHIFYTALLDVASNILISVTQDPFRNLDTVGAHFTFIFMNLVIILEIVEYIILNQPVSSIFLLTTLWNHVYQIPDIFICFFSSVGQLSYRINYNLVQSQIFLIQITATVYFMRWW